MNYMLDGTMVNMTYPEIEELLREKALVLLPVAVIEEHGPHLPLGTDAYITCSMLRYIQNKLRLANVKSVIAPPFYWGINTATNAFPGSFTVKVETMKAVLKDTIECLQNWGFDRIFILNMHGDYLQTRTILETVMEIHRPGSGKKALDIIPGLYKPGDFKLPGCEAFALFPAEEKGKSDSGADRGIDSPYLDLHAGAFETSFMLLEYGELVDEETARSLSSSRTDMELFKEWRKGGARAREITPLGYCGDPSNIDLESAKAYIDEFSGAAAKLIIDSLVK